MIPNPLPQEPQPRSSLDQKTFVTAGRLVPEKQFEHLVDAFWRIVDQIPGWPLRIWGDGPRADNLAAQVRKLELEGRVELPGTTADMTAEWAARAWPCWPRGPRATRWCCRRRCRPACPVSLRLPVRTARDHHARRQRPARPARRPSRRWPQPCCGWPPTVTSGRDSVPARSRALAAWDATDLARAVGRRLPRRRRPPRRPARPAPGAPRPAPRPDGRPARDLLGGRRHARPRHVRPRCRRDRGRRGHRRRTGSSCRPAASTRTRWSSCRRRAAPPS